MKGLAIYTLIYCGIVTVGLTELPFEGTTVFAFLMLIPLVTFGILQLVKNNS